MLEEAARVSSPVAHVSNTGTHVGLAVGAGVAVVLAVFSGGISLVAFAGYASLGMGAGGLLDKYVVPEDGSEKIIEGVVHVLLDEAKLQAAHASEITKTDQHGGFVTTGSDSVFIEGFPASRRTDSTSCAGTIARGSAHIFYGGALSGAGPGQYLSGPMQGVSVALTLVGFAKNPKNAWDWFKRALDVVGVAEGVGVLDENPIPESIRDVKSTISVIEGLIKRGRELGAVFGR